MILAVAVGKLKVGGQSIKGMLLQHIHQGLTLLYV